MHASFDLRPRAEDGLPAHSPEGIGLAGVGETVSAISAIVSTGREANIDTALWFRAGFLQRRQHDRC